MQTPWNPCCSLVACIVLIDSTALRAHCWLKILQPSRKAPHHFRCSGWRKREETSARGIFPLDRWIFSSWMMIPDLLGSFMIRFIRIEHDCWLLFPVLLTIIIKPFLTLIKHHETMNQPTDRVTDCLCRCWSQVDQILDLEERTWGKNVSKFRRWVTPTTATESATENHLYGGFLK